MWSILSELFSEPQENFFNEPRPEEPGFSEIRSNSAGSSGAGAATDSFPNPQQFGRPSQPSLRRGNPESSVLEDVPLYEELLILYAAQRPLHHTSRSYSVHTLNGAGGTELSRGSADSLVTHNSALQEPHKQRTKNPKPLFARLGLRFLNSRQHFALALSRDISLVPALLGMFNLCKYAFVRYRALPNTMRPVHFAQSIIEVGVFEHLLAGLWCLVAAILSYSMLDGLIGRWIITYLTLAAIVRVLSMSTIMISLEQYLVLALSTEGQLYALHIWILISCILTIAYTIQSFVTSNTDFKLNEPNKARFFDIYNIVVFAVVPVGLASFITMIGLLRSLLIMRIDLDHPSIGWP